VILVLSCRACGSNRIAFNQAVSDACEVRCEDCGGRVGTYGELKAAVADQLARGSVA
jgi:predicted nucleic acid-binding Zn ribbon protein